MIVLYENTTSADVNGVPSCHFTPCLILNVKVSLSSDISQDSARRGFSSSVSLSRSMSVS